MARQAQAAALRDRDRDRSDKAWTGELFCPSCLLGGYTLEVLGPVTVAGPDAIAVAATPRRDVLGSGSAERSYDRIEVAVDAELGILLRRAETARGELFTLTELTDLTMNPPEAADPGRFTAPPGSHHGETLGEKVTPARLQVRP